MVAYVYESDRYCVPFLKLFPKFGLQKKLESWPASIVILLFLFEINRSLFLAVFLLLHQWSIAPTVKKSLVTKWL